MDWSADSEGVREQLMRIVALLLGLSVLAERACGAPLAVRLYVMGLLRPAEQAAWVFIRGDAAMPGGEDDGPASAMLLAARLRALAIVLAAFAERFCGCSRVRVGILRGIAETIRHFAELDRGGRQPFDTS